MSKNLFLELTTQSMVSIPSISFPITNSLNTEVSQMHKISQSLCNSNGINAINIPNNFDYTEWNVIDSKFDPSKLHHRETVFTIGNGYLGTRGSFEEGYPCAMPATLINGIYDDVPMVYTELANCPDWLPIAILIAGERFRLDRGEILNYQQQLDLQKGLLSRYIRWRSQAGHTVDIYFERFASLAQQHLTAIRCQILSIDFTGLIEVQSSINGYPDNQGVRHWEWLDQGGKGDMIWLNTSTRHTNIELAMATQLQVNDTENPEIQIKGCQGYPTVAANIYIQPGKIVTLDKIVTIFTTRETATPVKAAKEQLANVSDYLTLRSNHIAAWAQIWENSDIIIAGDRLAQIAVRYNIFQAIIAAPQQDDRVSIPAKTLSGFSYRGHIFWDTEIFLVPLFTFTQPKLARNLLTYRYHTLAGARRKAAEFGYEGAMFAWESATTGEEVTPRWVPPAGGGKELVRIWCGDIELHITSDIAYAVWQYWQATGDDDWMINYGAELILDTAVFWGCRVEWYAEKNRYEIRDVIGPDEYHDHVNNNAFTNQMVKWHLETALIVLNWLRQNYPDRATELETQLKITPKRLDTWGDISKNLWVSEDLETGLIEQFEGFCNLENINLHDYEPRQKSMQSILGIAKANQRQVLKQADVLMLLFLLREKYTKQVIETNWNYYNPRTDHTYGSSLGPCIHAILACEIDKPSEAYEHFLRAAMVDLEDVRGNADEGIHAASAGGIWQAVIFGFAGLRITETGPIINPHLPPSWNRLQFKIQWRDRSYEFDLKLNPGG